MESALPDTEIRAEIKEIGREASQATRTYPVTLIMGQPDDGEILPGMAGQASILSRPPEESALVGIEIPATALCFMVVVGGIYSYFALGQLEDLDFTVKTAIVA